MACKSQNTYLLNGIHRNHLLGFYAVLSRTCFDVKALNMVVHTAAPMKLKWIFQGLGLIFLFAALFVLNSFSISDGDYFWHVNTGQWIWEHRVLPVSDPFSFTVTDSNPFRPESGRVQFILQQYWLAQLALYSLWSWGGEASIVVLRALVHSGLIFAVFWCSWRRAGIYCALIFAALTFCQFQTIPNERPQLFTCLFVFLLVTLLEKVTDRSRPVPGAIVVGLPVMMLMWANMHGGYILGLCVITAYAVGFCLEQSKSFDSASWKKILLLIGSGVITMANPVGLTTLFSELFATQSNYLSGVQENVSSVKLILSGGIMSHIPYVVMLLLTIVTLINAFKQMRATHLLAVGGVFVLSLLAFRYQVFLFLLAPLVATYLPFPQKKLWAVPVATLLIVFLLTNTKFQKPSVFAASPEFPAAAIEFVRTTQPSQNLFNYYDWGGYLAFKAPEYKVFVDGRGLVEEFVTKHDEVLYEEKLSALDDYTINTTIFPINNLATGKVIPLAVMLMYDPDWKAVFMGRNSLVFVRNAPENKAIISTYAIHQDDLARALVDAYDRMLVLYPAHYRALVTKAQLQENIGDLTGAIHSLKRAQAVNPESLYVREAIQRLMRKSVRLGSG